MSLSLKINIVDGNVTKTIVFNPTTTVYDACKIIREKCTEADLGQRKYLYCDVPLCRVNRFGLL